MRSSVLAIIFWATITTAFGQDNKKADCFEIKYLDFFGLDRVEIAKWSETEIKTLLATNFERGNSDPTIKTNFIVPMIIYQLTAYHPNCNSKIDSSYFDQISKLYFKIRGIDANGIALKSIPEKIEFMRNDFYKQVEDDRYLPHMVYTFDDGPLYGVDFDQNQPLNPVKTQETEFGVLSISKVNDETILTGKDKKGKVIWQKLITGAASRKLTEIHFAENPMEYNSVATVAHMYAEGERFTLYLKKDGRFMYYYHSW